MNILKIANIFKARNIKIQSIKHVWDFLFMPTLSILHSNVIHYVYYTTFNFLLKSKDL